MATLEQAIRALAADDQDHASERNGIGYNGSDSGWGNRLAELSRSGRLRWRVGEYAEAHARLAKYAGQLSRAGIEWNTIPAAPPYQPERPSTLTATMPGTCESCGGRIEVGAAFKWGSGRGARVHLPNCLEAHVGVNPGTVSPSSSLAPVQAAPVPIATQPAPMSADPDADKYQPHMDVLEVIGPRGLLAQRLTGYEARTQQMALATAVQQAMTMRTNLIAEAPTGTGKSLAYLIPAALMALRPSRERGDDDDSDEGRESGGDDGQARPRKHRASSNPVIVVTGDKSLQAQITLKDAPFVESLEIDHHNGPLFTELKGLSNYLCVLRYRETKGRMQDELFGGEGTFRTVEDANLWPDVDRWAASTADGDLERVTWTPTAGIRELITTDSDNCLSVDCPVAKQCHYLKTKERAEHSKIVIANYALYMRHLQVQAMTDGAVGILPEESAVVLDEAHHLEEAATDAFGEELALSRWDRLARRIGRLTWEHRLVLSADRMASEEQAARLDAGEQWSLRVGAVAETLQTLFTDVAQRVTDSGESAIRMPNLWDAGASVLDAQINELADAMGDQQPEWLDATESKSWGRLWDQAGKLGMTVRNLFSPAFGDRGIIRYAELEGNNGHSRLVLHWKPIDVSQLLSDRLWHPEGVRRAVIAMSATLAETDGFDHWRQRVGLHQTRELIVGSPFDFERHAMLYVPEGPDGSALDPSQARDDRQREAYFDALALTLQRLVTGLPRISTSGGSPVRPGAFLLFTSGKAMREMHRRLVRELEHVGFTVLLQGQGATRQKMVAQFREGGAVLFGLKSYWEGVDIQGQALSLVVIDKMPFAPPTDPVWAAKCAAVDAKHGRQGAWFMELALPAATIAIKQGFGRLIRTRTDRGVIAILDGRLTSPQKRYGAKLLRALPPAQRTSSLTDVARFLATV